MIDIEKVDPKMIREMLTHGMTYTESYNLIDDTPMKPYWKFRSKKKMPIEEMDAKSCAAAALHCVREMNKLATLLGHIEDRLIELYLPEQEIPVREEDWRMLKQKIELQQEKAPIGHIEQKVG